MDDSLEQPNTVSKPLSSEQRTDDEESSGDEDEGPDWTKIPTVARPIIPKRGEKEFEPSVSGGSGLQRHVLDRARSAMLETLKATRTTSSKSMSYGIWYPRLARMHVTTARGIHFSNMGHSVARESSAGLGDMPKAIKRLELLPEEAIYLVERGSLFCWKESDVHMPVSLGLEQMEGAPMTVQQAFAEMIGKEDLTLEKYQVFAYLKRLGYVVTRTKPPSVAYPAAAPFLIQPPPQVPILVRLMSALTRPFKHMYHRLLKARDWWQPLLFYRWPNHNMSYSSIFKSLRFLQAGNSAPLYIKAAEEPSPYVIFYNVYKPSTPFRKTAPPAPDFSVVVVNARTTSIPTIAELDRLFGVLPELPPPIPRRRVAFSEKKDTQPQVQVTSPASPPINRTFFQRVFPWIFTSTLLQTPPQRKPNPFAMLKAGKKMVIIAAVDEGTISFFRFGQGAFEDFPMN